MPWLQIIDDWTDLPGHSIGEPMNSRAKVRFREEFAGRYVFGSEPELYETSCGAPFVWTLMDGQVQLMLRECGLGPTARVAVCPHEVQHISYNAKKPNPEDRIVLGKPGELVTGLVLVSKRKFRHSE